MSLASSPPLLATLDSNVIVSGGTVSHTPPSQIIQGWRVGAVEFAMCEAILGEVQDVLSRPYFADHIGWTQENIVAYVNELRKGSLIVPAKTKVNVCRDPDDNMVFSCAMEAQSDYIVSGDEDILDIGIFQGIPTLPPAQFVEVMKRHKRRVKAA